MACHMLAGTTNTSFSREDGMRNEPCGKVSRRRVIATAGAGLAGILASGRAPLFAQTAAKKLVFAHINARPESAADAFAWMAEEVNKRANGALEVQFHGSTL